MKGSRGFGAIALEMASIIVAVVLGFAVSSWDEGRRERQRARDAVERIAMELDANEKEMRDLPAYFVRVVQEIDSVVAERGDGPFEMRALPSWEGIRPPVLRTSSFAVATSTGALEHVDFAVADELAAVYELIGHARATTDSGMQALVSGAMDDFSDIRMFLILLREQVVTVLGGIEELQLPPGTGPSGSR